MPVEKPQQFLPQVTGNAAVDHAQDAISQLASAQRSQGTQKRIVDKLSPTEPPARGIQLRPNQTVDIPHSVGHPVSSIGVASIIDSRSNAAAAPRAAPNLQLIELPSKLGSRIVRVRYIPPKDDAGKDIPNTPSFRAKLELG